MDRRQLLIGLAAAGVVTGTGLVGCTKSTVTTTAASGGAAAKGALVGVLMPTKDSQRWIDDGANVKKALEAKGYTVEVLYANNEIPQQQSQLEAMVGKGAKALVIAAIDGTTLTTQLATAGGKGVKVVAYDRLINGTETIDSYATFDNKKVGTLQGTSLLEGLGFMKDGKDTGFAGPKNIEIFSGATTDNNTKFFYGGAMEVLKPYLDAKKLVIKSGQTTLEQTATPYWKLEEAQKRCDALLGTYYSKGDKMDGAVCAYDGLTRGVLNSVTNAGAPLPILTGQDAEKPSCKLILDGKQYSSILKDTRDLAKKAAEMVDDLLNGKKPAVNDEKTYDNGKKVVPTFQLDPQIVTKDNLMKLIVDSGYYTKAQVEAGQ